MRRIALIAGLALVILAVPAAALDPGETVLVSQATDGTNASGSAEVSVSGDGGCVVFSSVHAALPGANGIAQIYLRDTEAGTTTLVSENDAGTGGGDGPSRNAAITPDCRFVAWSSEATDLTATAQSQHLVYRRDLQTDTTIVVSRADGASGPVPNQPAFVPAMSADGNEIAFGTSATNLSTADSDAAGHTDIFLRDVDAADTELVTVDSAEAGQDGDDGARPYASISADGRYVAFDSDAANLTDADDDAAGHIDVFRRDRVAGTTALVSRVTGVSGEAGDNRSVIGRISADGGRVAFVSLADNFGAGTGFMLQVYVRDFGTDETILVSRANGAAGAPGNAGSGSQPGLEISGDGTKVVFDSLATNLPDDTPDGAQFDVVLRDLSANTTQMVARSSSGALADTSFWATLSPDGTHVAFTTPSGLVPSDTDGQYDVYLRGLGGSGGPGPTPTPTAAPTAAPGTPATPATPAAPAAVTLRGDAAFARGTANDLYLACTTLDLYLVDVLPAGRRVAVTGAADLRLVGQTVEILLDGRRVGSAVVRSDGSFAARVAAPSRRRRARARYQARIGSTASQRLRLARRMVATTLTRSGANLVLRGVVNAPRARRQPAIAVERFLSCRRREAVKVPRVRPDRRGRFAVRIKVPAGAQAVLYRARTKVPARAGRPATKGTFTLPRAANVG